MDKIRVAIVEDNKKDAEDLIRKLTQYELQHPDCSFEKECFPNAISFLDRYEPRYEMVFMDIDMPYLDGVTATERLRKMDDKVILIFVTALAQYAVHGYGVGALDFFVKPMNDVIFEEKMDRAVFALQKNRRRQLFIRNADEMKVIDVQDILYVETVSHFLHFHLESTSHIYKMRETMKTLKKLVSDLYFEECNNGILVNLAKVSTIEGYSLEMVNGEHVTISRAKKSSFIRRLAEYHGNWKLNMGRLQS